MVLNKKTLVYLSIAYIYIPIALFLFGWTSLWIALACSIFLGYCIYKMATSFSVDDSKDSVKIKIKIGVLFIVVIFFLFIGYFAGWGRWVNQSYDWYKHNAVLKDLTTKSWPVYYKNGSEKSMLTYYIAQYLVPASFGKILHSFRAAEIMNYIWAEIGLILVWLNLVRIIKIDNKIKQILSAVILVFFNYPLHLAQFISEIIPNLNGISSGYDMHWFSHINDIKLQYSSNFTLLRWVFPQVIVIWLTVLLFIENKEKIQHYLTLMLPSLLFGTLSFIGFIPLAIGLALFDLLRNRKFTVWLKKIFSLENIITLLTLGSVLVLYFYGNILCEKPKDISFELMKYGKHWPLYFIFVVVMVLFYSLLIWNDNKRNELFYFALLSLIILPLFKMGMWNDLVMRSSIPSLFILMYLIIKFLNKYIIINKSKDNNVILIKKSATIIVCFLLLISSHYPYLELENSIKASRNETVKETNFGSMEIFANRDLEIPPDVKYNYYSYDIEGNIFYKFISRKKIN